MSQKVMFTAVVCVAALVLLATWSAMRWSEVNVSQATPATLPAVEYPQAAMLETLRQREHEIERLRGEILRLEALLAQQREVASPELASSVEASVLPEQSVASGSANLEAARFLLQTLLPEQFGSLSPEEAAAITKLDLRGSKVTDADLAVLAALPALASISLRGTAVTDAGMAALAGSSQLAAIDLRNTQITAVGLAALPLYKLDALHLTDTKVEADDMRRLPPMPNLRVLKLNGLQVGDDALRHLPYVPALEHLELDRTPITATGLRDALAANPTLRRIEMRQTSIDQESLASLQADYPGVEFVSDTPGGPDFRFYR